MSSLRFRIVLATMLAFLPLIVLAAPPDVTGITASKQDEGKVLVEWSPVEGATAYRIFYSHASILGNQGLYDDFEVAEKDATSFTLQNLPPMESVYVSVLAVNEQGEESERFTEEASVTRDGTPQQPPPSSASSTLFQLYKAESTTMEQLILTFSAVVSIDQSRASGAVIVRRSDGTVLPLRKLTVNGNAITVDTAPQTPGAVYAVEIGDAVHATNTEGKPLMLDLTQRSLLFTGFGEAVAPPAPPAQAPSDVGNLRLKAQYDGDGEYTVTLTWDPPASGAAYILISQSGDDGKTFSPPILVAPEKNNASIAHMTAVRFTAKVQVQGADDQVTQGVTQSITLPKGGSLVGSVAGTTHLPNSGVGAGMVVALSVFGAELRRRMRKVVA